jgi:hypothetical protein
VKKFLAISAAAGFFAFFAVVFLALGADWYRNKRAPDQPIAFSHKIHVGKVGLKCETCHEYTDKSMFAGIPSVQKCMSCHAQVATDRPEVQKLAGYWERQEPIPWNRIHRIRIREHVFFSHKRHMKADVDPKLECADCHGEVQYKDKLRQVSSLEMGWCVSCHDSKGASTDCLICHR